MRIKRPRERRQAARKLVTWTGRFGLNGAPEWDWRDCSIEDISQGGARVIAPADAAAHAGDAIAMAVERLGTTVVGIRLHGHIRYCEQRDGSLDLGVALNFRTPQERQLAQTLFAG